MPESERRIEMVMLKKDVETIANHIAENTVMTKKMYDVLIGDGTANGICTKVRVLEVSQKRSWWFLGGIAMAVMGAAIFIIKGSILGG